MTRSQGQSSRSQNAITMETLSNRLDAMSARIDARMDEMSARIDARMDEMSGQQAEVLKMVTLLVKEIEHLKNQREVLDKLVEDDDHEDGDEEENESSEASDEEESGSAEEESESGEDN